MIKKQKFCITYCFSNLLDIHNFIIWIQAVKSLVSFSNATKTAVSCYCCWRRHVLWRRLEYTLWPFTIWDTLVLVTRTVFIFWHLKFTNVQSLGTFKNSKRNILSHVIWDIGRRCCIEFLFCKIIKQKFSWICAIFWVLFAYVWQWHVEFIWNYFVIL